jgi:hypothetical protein
VPRPDELSLGFAAEVAEKRFDLLSLQVNRNDNQCVEIL